MIVVTEQIGCNNVIYKYLLLQWQRNVVISKYLLLQWQRNIVTQIFVVTMGGICSDKSRGRGEGDVFQLFSDDFQKTKFVWPTFFVFADFPDDFPDDVTLSVILDPSCNPQPIAMKGTPQSVLAMKCKIVGLENFGHISWKTLRFDISL